MAPRKKKAETAEEGAQAAPEAAVETKKRGKRVAEGGVTKKASPAKKGRTKKAAAAAGSPKKKGRGVKKVEEPESSSPTGSAEVEENNAAASPVRSPKKATPAKAKATPKKRGAAKKAPKSPKSPVANGAGAKTGRGRKKATDDEAPKATGRGKRAAPADDDADEATSPPKAKKGRQAKATTTAEVESKSPAKSPAKRGRKAKAAAKTGENGGAEVAKKDGKPRANKTSTDYTQIDFGHSAAFKLKVASWNVSGMRAWIGKGGMEYIEHEKPDIFCLQEIKCKNDDMPPEARVKGYHPYWLCHSGYAGVAVYSKTMPMNVTYGIGDAELDEEGRAITAEFEKFYLVCVYVPNAGRGLVTLPKRLRFDEKFQAFVSRLDQNKPVIICGDMNVAHQEIDLANPKTNKKNAGFTQEERDSLTKLFCLGFVDTFRHLYPKQAKAYTFWTYMMNARAKNVGWRLDYFIVSERLAPAIVDSIMRSPVMGSDHCPIVGLFNI
ncbi:exodeoxyribonuclease [Lutzomyia longipalpis]|uniref:exodeoxyribonuclease n=1 Tax=Lutzomyia longipalpis TaxID=7200 RepID=UPI0024843699|nr:exodeoxyribonuclease [Lutzomyia longipalpis]XP_055683955.1 exodeoxyribonuclease [Lutzomyia longipalpis]